MRSSMTANRRSSSTPVNLGAVMIATNMAGRGTDIKLGQFGPADLVEHWKQRGICPRDVTAELDEDEIIRRRPPTHGSR